MKKIITATVLLSFLSVAQAKDVIDTLVLYTDSARNLYKNDDAKLIAQIKNQINTANLVFRRSGLDVTINTNLLNTDSKKKELAIRHIDVNKTVESESLNKLEKEKLDDIKDIQKLKRIYKPDIVIFYRQFPSSDKLKNGKLLGRSKYILGRDDKIENLKNRIAKLKKNSAKDYIKYKNTASVFLNLTKKPIASTNTVHEIGHLLGIMHPKELALEQGYGYCKEKKHNSKKCIKIVNNMIGYYSYSQGYGKKGKFTTVMGYAYKYGVKKPKLLFSSPDILKCKGEACGIDKFDEKRGADAVSTIRDTAKILANFQQSSTFSKNDKERLKKKILRELRSTFNKYKKAKSRLKRKIYVQEILNKIFYEYKPLFGKK